MTVEELFRFIKKENMKHHLKVESTLTMARTISCHPCEDPEDETCGHIWIDWNGEVIYDADDPETLRKFLEHHSEPAWGVLPERR
jgi:hypothetical protein